MTRWRASVLAILLASFPGVVSAQVDCNAVPAGPARTDYYIGLSRVYRGGKPPWNNKATKAADLLPNPGARRGMV
jgi:hypothetical protein